MKEKYPNIQVLPVQYSDGDPQKAMDKTIDMVQANPDIAGIYATNEGSTPRRCERDRQPEFEGQSESHRF